MIKYSAQQADTEIVNAYTSSFIKQTLKLLGGIMKGYNELQHHIFITKHIFGVKISKETLKYTVKQTNLTDIYQLFHLTAVEYTVLS